MPFTKRLLSAILVASLLSQTGCGTLLYPERRGQIDGRIDPAVAAFDAIGILFFILPGVVALAVDFTTGAIYLPHGRYSVAPELLRDTLDSHGQPDRHKLRQLLRTELGHDMPLDDARLTVEPINRVQLASSTLFNPEA